MNFSAISLHFYVSQVLIFSMYNVEYRRYVVCCVVTIFMTLTHFQFQTDFFRVLNWWLKKCSSIVAYSRFHRMLSYPHQHKLAIIRFFSFYRLWNVSSFKVEQFCDHRRQLHHLPIHHPYSKKKKKKRKMMHTSCHRCSGIRTWLIIYAKSANDSRWVWSFAMICYDEWNRRGMLIGFIKGQTEKHSRASRYDNNDVSKLIDSLDIIRRPFVDRNFLLQHFFDVYLKIFDFTAHDVDSWQRSATAVEQWNEDGDDDWKIVDEREKKISEQQGDWSKAKYRRAVKMKWEICEMRTMAVKIPYFRGSRLSSWTFR